MPKTSKLPTLVLYTRKGCHLCEQAESYLNLLAFMYIAIDVDSSEDLKSKFGDDVPVLVLEEQILAKGVLSKSRLSMIKLHLIKMRQE